MATGDVQGVLIWGPNRPELGFRSWNVTAMQPQPLQEHRKDVNVGTTTADETEATICSECW